MCLCVRFPSFSSLSFLFMSLYSPRSDEASENFHRLICSIVIFFTLNDLSTGALSEASHFALNHFCFTRELESYTTGSGIPGNSYSQIKNLFAVWILFLFFICFFKRVTAQRTATMRRQKETLINKIEQKNCTRRENRKHTHAYACSDWTTATDSKALSGKF